MIDEQRLRTRVQRAIGYVPPTPSFVSQRVSLLIAGSTAQRDDRQRYSTLMAVVAAALAAVIVISLVFAAHSLQTKRPTPAHPKAVRIAVCEGQCQVTTYPGLTPLPATTPPPAALSACTDTGCDVKSFFATSRIGWMSESVLNGSQSFLYRSDDAGQHWRPVLSWSGSGAQQIRTSSDGSEALVFTWDGLFHTIDGGSHWSSNGLPRGVADGDGVYFVDPRDGWFLSGAYELDHTTDSGAHWRSLGFLPISVGRQGSNPDPGSSLKFVDSETGYLVVGPANCPLNLSCRVADQMPSGWNLLVTRDGGITWEPRSLPRPNSVSPRAEIGRASASFFGSLDGVAELDYCPEGCGKPSGGAPTQSFASVTSDGGKHWSPPVLLPAFAALPGEGMSVFVDKDHWFRIVDDGIPWLIDYTADGGHHWLHLATTPQGGPPTATSAVWKGGVSLDFIDASQGWAISGPHLWFTNDGGLTWTQVDVIGIAWPR